jgi:hypothetical protein
MVVMSKPAVHQAIDQVHRHPWMTWIVRVLLLLEAPHLRLLVPGIGGGVLARRVANGVAIIDHHWRHEVVVEQFMLIIAADQQNVQLRGLHVSPHVIDRFTHGLVAFRDCLIGHKFVGVGGGARQQFVIGA